MDRRGFLAASVGGLPLAVGGCLADDPDPDPDDDSTGRDWPPEGSTGRSFDPHTPEPSDPPELPVGPKDPPDPPLEVTVDSVAEYTAAFEYAYVYNTLYCRDLDTIDVIADSVLERETAHGVYTFAAASGFSRCGSGPEPEHRDYGRAPFEWVVGGNFVVRVDDVDSVISREPDRAYGADGGRTPAAGLYFTNFDHLAHEVDVRVEYDGETAYENTIDIGPHAGVRVQNVTAVRGDHELSVGTDEDETATGSWAVDPERTVDRMVRILATGEIEVEYLDPFSEL